MKNIQNKLIILSFLGTSLFSSVVPDLVPNAPESAGIQIQKLDEIDKTIKSKRTTKAIIDKLRVSKEAEGKGENRIKGQTFVLQNVSITGNTIFDQQVIIDIVKPFVGKSVDSLDLKYISQKVTQLYKEKGYITSKCIIPAQKVKNGFVKFEIREDKLGRVILKGKTTYNYDTNIFMRYLAQLQGKIINVDELNTQLKLLSNLPVTRIEPSLEKTKIGYTNLVLKVTEGKENFSITYDNSGSKFTGENRFTLNGRINNIRGKSDSLGISLTTVSDTKNLTSLSLNYIHPYGRDGGNINFFLSKMNYMMVLEGEDTKSVFASNGNVTNTKIYYTGTSDNYGMAFTKSTNTIYNMNLLYTYGFENRTTTLGDVRATYDVFGIHNNDIISSYQKEDKNFVVNSGLNIGKSDSIFGTTYKGYNAMAFSFKKGVEGFLNSSKLEDTTVFNNHNIKDHSNMGFIKYYYKLSRQQQLPFESILNLNINGSYTKDRVPDSYETSGGDYGYTYSASLSKKIGFVNSVLSLSQSKIYTFDENLKLFETLEDPSVGLGLNSTYKNLYFALSYSSSINSWDSNVNNLRYSLSYSY
jgi:hemolysin activation/secretion protein